MRKPLFCLTSEPSCLKRFCMQQKQWHAVNFSLIILVPKNTLLKVHQISRFFSVIILTITMKMMEKLFEWWRKHPSLNNLCVFSSRRELCWNFDRQALAPKNVVYFSNFSSTLYHTFSLANTFWWKYLKFLFYSWWTGSGWTAIFQLKTISVFFSTSTFGFDIYACTCILQRTSRREMRARTRTPLPLHDPYERATLLHLVSKKKRGLIFFFFSFFIFLYFSEEAEWMHLFAKINATWWE